MWDKDVVVCCFPKIGFNHKHHKDTKHFIAFAQFQESHKKCFKINPNYLNSILLNFIIGNFLKSIVSLALLCLLIFLFFFLIQLLLSLLHFNWNCLNSKYPKNQNSLSHDKTLSTITKFWLLLNAISLKPCFCLNFLYFCWNFIFCH